MHLDTIVDPRLQAASGCPSISSSVCQAPPPLFPWPLNNRQPWSC